MAQDAYLTDAALLAQNPEASDLSRQRKLAEMLTLQAFQQPQGGLVSGHYVAPSWTQQLAPLVSGIAGQAMSKKLDEKQLALAEALRGKQEADITKFGELMKTDPAAAYQFASKSNVPQLREAGLKKMMPEEVTLSEGQKRIITMPDGTTREIASGGEKLHVVKGKLVTSSGKEIYSAGGEGGGNGLGINGSNVNNNGVPIGKYDKVGRYISPTGRVYPAAAVTEAQKEHDTAMDLAYKLNKLTKDDIKNAYGSAFDYSGSKVGQFVGSEPTVSAQNKINNIQIKSVLDNLSQLKGAASDKDMAQMIKDFPGYTSSPATMEKWVERASDTTNRFLKRSEGRFGFDTEYAEQGRFGEKPKEQKGEIAVSSAPKLGEIRNGQDGKYRFKGGDQYDQKNWEKVK